MFKNCRIRETMSNIYAILPFLGILELIFLHSSMKLSALACCCEAALWVRNFRLQAVPKVTLSIVLYTKPSNLLDYLPRYTTRKGSTSVETNKYSPLTLWTASLIWSLISFPLSYRVIMCVGIRRILTSTRLRRKTK